MTAEGATWLDRELVARERTGLRSERFGKAAADALNRRRNHLIGHRLAERDGEAVRYRRNLLQLLRSREFAAAGERLAEETGMAFVETRDGERIEGVYRRPLRLASGKVGRHREGPRVHPRSLAASGLSLRAYSEPNWMHQSRIAS